MSVTESPPRPTRPPDAKITPELVEVIPPDLRECSRWVVWRWVWNPDKRGGTWDKPPVDPCNGVEIPHTDPSNWMTFDQAVAASGSSRLLSGVGITLGAPDDRLGFVGIDLDDCIDAAGNISDQARKIVHDLDSYTERTPSGTGLRILIWGDKPGSRCSTKNRPGVEIYESGRYLTVTGRHLEGTPTAIARRQEELEALYFETFPADKPKTTPAAGSNGHKPTTNDEIVEKARTGKGGAKFTALFDRGEIGQYGDNHSSADLALCNILAFWTGRDFNRIESLFSASALGQRDKWRNRQDYRERTIDRAIDDCTDVYDPQRKGKKRGSAQPSTNGDGHQGDDDQRPSVEVNTRRDLVVTETIKAIAGDTDLFCRGETLGVVVQEETETASLPGGVELRNAKGNLRFLVLSPSVLSCRLTRNIDFYRWTVDRKGEFISVKCHPAEWLVSAVAEQRYWPGLRNLLSITECPYVLADGSLATPGFDRVTGTLYQPSVKIAELPCRPNRAEAQEAGVELFKVFHQFPFENGFSWSVWLANLLTAIQRPMIRGPVPGFAYNGNKAGTGKGLLIDSIGVLVYGHEVATRAYTADPVEAEKVKLSLALAAVPVIHFDNLLEGGFYGGSVIDSALTSKFAEGRILGQSRESGPVPLRPVWMLSGNNISPMGDANRRWLPCNLVTKEESPHERSDITQTDLRGFLLEHRAELLRHALIILKSHALAKRPVGGSKQDPKKIWAPLGSFEEWDPVVRGAVWYATGNDCLTIQRETTDEMPDRTLKLALLEGWKEIDSDGKGISAAQAIELVKDNPAHYSTLRSALMSMSRDGKLPTAEKLGYKLRAMKKTPYSRMRFERSDEKVNHQWVWSVKDV